MASHIGIEAGRMSGGAGRNARAGHAGRRTEKLERRIGTDKPIRAVLANIIYDGIRIIILGSAVVVDLAEDAGGIIRRKGRCGDDAGSDTGAKRIGGRGVREL